MGNGDIALLVEWADGIDSILRRKALRDGITLSDEPPITARNARNFRPHDYIQNALIRLDVRFPQAVKQITECRDLAELFYRRCEADGFFDGNIRADLADALDDMSTRIRHAVEIISAIANGGAATLKESDKKGDKNKLSTGPRRGFTTEARKCATNYKAKLARGEKTTMKDVILAYVGKHGGSYNSIRKSLAAYPEQWKQPPKKGTK